MPLPLLKVHFVEIPFCWQWLVATLLGWLPGGLSLGLIGRAAVGSVWVVVGLILLTVILPGFLRWRVFNRRLPNTLWCFTYVLFWAFLFFAIPLAFSSLKNEDFFSRIPPILSFGLGVLLFSGWQWLNLRNRDKKAFWWVGINLLGFWLAAVPFYLIPTQSSLILCFVDLFIGLLLFGTLTGVGLDWLLQEPKNETSPDLTL